MTGPHVVGAVIQHDLDDELLRQLTGRSWGAQITLDDHDGPTLATGDMFVSDAAVRKRLAARASLVDMEAYALVAAARHAGVPIRVVKHVSDLADEDAAGSWRDAMKESAAGLAQWITENLEA
jgi:adenosylhomocysteine nucleosidase